MHASQGQGLKRPRLESAHQGEQVLFEVSLEHSDADLVNPRRAPVTFDVPEGTVHEDLGDPSRQRVSFDLGHFGSFPTEPRATDTLGSTWLPARGGCYLASAALLARGASGPSRAQRCVLTGLMVRRLRPPSHTDAPFAQGLLWSSCRPRSGPRWGRWPHRRVTRPFRSAYRSGLPWLRQGRRGTLTGQRGQPLCPGETTNHLDGPQPPTVTCAAERIRPDSPNASAGLGAWHTVSAESWPLPNYPCLAPSSPPVAGRRWLRPSPGRRVRARTSARVRPRTGRIRSIGVGSIAPFKTEPTTPAAHAKPEAPAKGAARLRLRFRLVSHSRAR